MQQFTVQQLGKKKTSGQQHQQVIVLNQHTIQCKNFQRKKIFADQKFLKEKHFCRSASCKFSRKTISQIKEPCQRCPWRPHAQYFPIVATTPCTAAQFQPKEPARCHLTLSSWVGSGDESTKSYTINREIFVVKKFSQSHQATKIHLTKYFLQRFFFYSEIFSTMNN